MTKDEYGKLSIILEVPIITLSMKVSTKPKMVATVCETYEEIITIAEKSIAIGTRGRTIIFAMSA